MAAAAIHMASQASEEKRSQKVLINYSSYEMFIKSFWSKLYWNLTKFLGVPLDLKEYYLLHGKTPFDFVP